MSFELWYMLGGLLLAGVGLAAPRLNRWPVSLPILYLLAGVAIGPYALGLLRLDPLESWRVLERVAEVAVIVSLFACGLKLTPSLRDRRWRLPLRLAFVSMALTVGGVALVGVYLLELPWGAAVLLGAVLAPTDPVLAADVDLNDPEDEDHVRFALTGEAGFNDGTAFPFVLLGLGLLGLHDLGPNGLRWLGVDVLWAISGGLGIGLLVGSLTGRLLLVLRRRGLDRLALDDFLALGILAFTYGLALLLNTYGFLAATALGLGLRRAERYAARPPATAEVPEATGDRADRTDEEQPLEVPPTAEEDEPDQASSGAVLAFTDQLQRFGELSIVVVLGVMLALDWTALWDALWFVPLLLLGIRPAAVLLGLVGAGDRRRVSRSMICWFGIRGVGSVYYLMHAVGHGLSREHAELITELTLATIATSIVVHGVSMTPLMRRHERKKRRDRRDEGDERDEAARGRGAPAPEPARAPSGGR